MEQLLVIFLFIFQYVLRFLPAFFWFFLIREFNARTNSKFPSVVYALLYLIPILGHCWIAWSFLGDLKEMQIKYNNKPIDLAKTYVTKFILPDIFLVVGPVIFVIMGAFLFSIPVIGGFLGDSIVWLANLVPYFSFLWLTWGFWSIYKIVKNLTQTRVSP